VPLGTEGEYFDPGKMGSYFQTCSEVQETLNIANRLEESVPDRNGTYLRKKPLKLRHSGKFLAGIYLLNA